MVLKVFRVSYVLLYFSVFCCVLLCFAMFWSMLEGVAVEKWKTLIGRLPIFKKPRRLKAD